VRAYCLLAAACAAALSFGVQASAQALSLADAAKAFGSREDITEATLSPDGKKVVFLAPIAGAGQGSVLTMIDTGGDATPNPIITADGDPDRISNCQWAASDRLLCNMFAVVPLQHGYSYVSRMIAINTDGSNAKMVQPRHGSGSALRTSYWGGGVIDWLPDEDGKVLMVRDYIPERSTGMLLRQSGNGLGVDEVDIRTLSSKTVERPDPKAVDYITDGSGVVRIIGRGNTNSSGYDTGIVHYSYRRKGSREWLPLADYDENKEIGFNPYHVDSNLDVVYGLEKVNGRWVAVTYKLDGSRQRALLFQAPGGVDVSGFFADRASRPSDWGDLFHRERESSLHRSRA